MLLCQIFLENNIIGAINDELRDLLKTIVLKNIILVEWGSYTCIA